MKKYLWAPFSILGVLLVGLLVRAAASSANMDSDLFNNESSCRPPCWHGLTPGQSTTTDVESFLDSFSTRFWWPLRSVHKFGNEIDSIRITNGGRSQSVDFYIGDGKLTFIRSRGSASVTLGQVVEHFGSPQYVRAVVEVGPETDVYALELYYPKRGLGFEISPMGMAISLTNPMLAKSRQTCQ